MRYSKLRDLEVSRIGLGAMGMSQVAPAWVLAQGDDIAPIPGTERVSRVGENTAADTATLTAEQLDRLSSLPPAAGHTPTEAQARMLDR